MPLRAILFDLDGTLIETEEVHRLAFNDTFTHSGMGWRWQPDEYRELLAIKGGEARIYHYITTRCADEVPEGERRELAGRLHRQKREAFRARIEGENRLTLRPGVARLMDSAQKEGIRLALVTASTRATVEPLLKSVPGLPPDVFDAVITGDQVAHNKPAPDLYALALKSLALSAGDCIAVEDCQMGVAAARAASVPALVTVSEYTAQGSFEEAWAVVSSLGEPHAPCRVITGAPLPGGVVDISWLARICHWPGRRQESA